MKKAMSVADSDAGPLEIRRRAFWTTRTAGEEALKAMREAEILFAKDLVAKIQASSGAGRPVIISRDMCSR